MIKTILDLIEKEITEEEEEITEDADELTEEEMIEKEMGVMGTRAFERRCQDDPHGVIRDLVAQTTKQANAIRQLNAQVARLEAQGIVEGKV